MNRGVEFGEAGEGNLLYQDIEGSYVITGENEEQEMKT